MINIYANLGTKERKAVFLNPNENDIQKLLNEKYGGEWILVNKFSLGDELRFEGSEIYKGFDPTKEDDNYCKGNLIKKSFKPNVKRYG